MIALQVKMRDGHTHVVSCGDTNDVNIGRAPGNHVLLPDVRVSGRHARLVLRDGKYIIVDLESTNGTYVNGKRISSPQVLKDSDKIYLGDITLMLTTDVSDAIGPSELPGWMKPADVERTVVTAPPPSPPAPTPARPAKHAGDDEVTPLVGMAPSPVAPPRELPPKRGGRTVIDDDMALGAPSGPPAAVAPLVVAPVVVATVIVATEAPRATKTLGVSVGERVSDDGFVVVSRGRASGHDARVVQLSDAMRDDAEAGAIVRDVVELLGCFRSSRLPRLLASESAPRTLFATAPPPGVCTLHDVLQRGGPLSPPLALHAALEVARALADFHDVRDARGVPIDAVHRGVTLRHVEIARDGTVHLEGFFWVKCDAPWRQSRTAPGTLKGDLAFMAPEQVRGLPVDARADLWALGVLLYAMVSGANPFVGETPFDTLELVRNASAPALDDALHDSLQPVVDALLTADRERRTASARDAVALLERAALTLPPATRLDLERRVR